MFRGWWTTTTAAAVTLWIVLLGAGHDNAHAYLHAPTDRVVRGGRPHITSPPPPTLLLTTVGRRGRNVHSATLHLGRHHHHHHRRHHHHHHDRYHASRHGLVSIWRTDTGAVGGRLRSDGTASTRTTTTTTTTTGTATTSTSLHGGGGGTLFDVTVAKASVAATAKLLSAIGLGGLAASKPGLLDAPAIGALSRLTYWVFQPAFLFCSVSRTIYTAFAATTSTTTATANTGLSLRALWLMPALGLAQILTGAIAGRILAKAYGVSDDEVPNVRMCTTFANSGPLPLIFADALFGGNPLLQSQMAAGISFYLLAWSPLFWTLGKVILGAEEETDPDSDRLRATMQKVLSPPVLGSLAGLIVGMVGPLRNVFLRGWLVPLYGALQSLGTAYLPAALLVLAGSLVGKKATTGGAAAAVATEGGAAAAMTAPANDAPTVRGMAAIATYRFLISPLLSFSLVGIIRGFAWMDARTKAIVTFLCLMGGCMPPAQNSVILLQLVGKTGPAAAMAKLLTIMYAGAVLPVTILLTLCLQRSGILAYL